MKIADKNQCRIEMDQLCLSVRNFVENENFESCIDMICQAMERYPHAPQPHNLLGIVMEKTGKHGSAIRHFRAAEALDPEYLPAKFNLSSYATVLSDGICAFDESDLTLGSSEQYEVIIDDRKVGHVVRRKKIEYDEHGIGHVVRM